MELRRFFDRAIRASFQDLALAGDPTAEYLADLCTRFARTENLFPKGVAVRSRSAPGARGEQDTVIAPRLETVVDMLLEVQAAWAQDSPYWQPERELAVRRHIGDYTLFMTGVFRERVERIASTGFYISEGKRAYHFVSEHDRAAAKSAAPIYRRLAERFESYARALDYARRVYFIEHEGGLGGPGGSLFRFGLG